MLVGREKFENSRFYKVRAPAPITFMNRDSLPTTLECHVTRDYKTSSAIAVELVLLFFLMCGMGRSAAADEQWGVGEKLEHYCYECHDNDTKKGKMSGLTEALKSWTSLLAVLGVTAFIMSIILSLVFPLVERRRIQEIQTR